nr:hypothetical protein [uncultured Desulfobacter sp.]
MWKRKAKDPLARLFVDRYGLHMLPRPRETLSVYDVFPVAGNRAASPGTLAAFVDAQLPFPEIRRGEVLADVCGTTSDSVSGSAGFKFLEGFFAAVGAIPVLGKLSNYFAAGRSAGIRFRFANAVRDSVDVFAFERVLRKHKCSRDDLLMKDGYSYYVVIGVHRSDSLGFKLLDSKFTEMDLATEITGLSSGQFELKATGDRELVIKSDKQLAYGVELSELVYNPTRTRLELDITKDYVKVMAPGDALNGIARSMIGGPEDSLMLEFEKDL